MSVHLTRLSAGLRSVDGTPTAGRTTTMRLSLSLSALSAVLLLGACMAPAVRFEQRALDLGLTRDSTNGDPFRHVVYHRTGDDGNGSLHVYIDGDGTPFLRRHWISKDPTPRQPVLLSMLALDRNPALYLGRPCYHGLAAEAPCSPALWTRARYSPAVVTSMAVALGRWLRAQPERPLVFVGYSGGGTLAMLLAARFSSRTRAVLTVGANLDPDAWTRHHGYTPLFDSLNPSRTMPLPPHIVQRHFIGSEDRVVPPELLRAAAARLPGAEVTEIGGFDHSCCWQQIWPALLEGLD